MVRPLPFVDLDAVAFSVPGSRFVLEREGAGVRLLHVRYEVPLDECVVARLGASGPVRAASGRVDVGGWRVAILGDEARVWGPIDEGDSAASHAHHGEVAAGPGAVRLGRAPDVEVDRVGQTLRFRSSWSEGSSLSDEEFLERADEVVDQWMGRTPRVGAVRQEMANQCWWVLGTNIVRLHAGDSGGEDQPVRDVVVPSMRGYVALWQWDAYFIALGLRHGDTDLALEQLEVAFSPTPDGQLPDVVHDGGVLASSEDLPPGDRAKLVETGSPTLQGRIVPLTKPPLAAWAAQGVLECCTPTQRTERLTRWFDIVAASQEWWFSEITSDRGVPIYAHPYSSGLDDSPVFDGELPVRTPDLLAYLAIQDRVLAQWSEDVDVPEDSARSRSALLKRSAHARALLEELWIDSEGMFAALNPQGTALMRTVVSLLGCFAPDLGEHQIRAVLADLADPTRFGSTWRVPTVSMDEPSFEVDMMWRGPVWVNTTYLVAEGLEEAGYEGEAWTLRSQVLDLVEHAGGPMEYMSSVTGTKSPHSTTSFGWSAALYIDLAVREAARTS